MHFAKRKPAPQWPCSAPFVQFSSKVYFAPEGQPSVLLHVLRLGDCSGAAEVKFSCTDVTAKAGVNYVAKTGKLVFQAGSRVEKLEIVLLESLVWEQTFGFTVSLSEAESEAGGVAVGQVSSAMVFILDEAPFPSGRCTELIKSENMFDLPDRCKLLLFVEWLRHLLSSVPALRKRVLKHLLLDQLHVLDDMILLIVQVLLVDFVLSPGKIPKDSLWLWLERPNRNAALIAVALVAPVMKLALHFFDFRKVKYNGLVTPVMKSLQFGILRQFFHLSIVSRHGFRNGAIMEMMIPQAEKVVNGSVHVVMLPKLVSQILVGLAFNVCCVVLFDKEFQVVPVLAGILVYPAVVVVLIKALSKQQQSLTKEESERSSNLYEYGSDMVEKCQAILDTFTRGKYGKHFENQVHKCRETANKIAVLELHADYTLSWAIVLLTSVYTIIAGWQFLHGDDSMKIGIILANISIIKLFGFAWADFYKMSRKIQRLFPDLVGVVMIMNAPTDYQEAAERSAFRDEETLERFKTHEFLDSIPIFINSPQFRLLTGMRASLNLAGLVEIRQGQLVCVFGHHGVGVTSFLRMLAGDFLSGADHVREVFVPSHLNIGHVAKVPILMNETLMSNLTMGARSHHDGSAERILRICERIGMTKALLEVVKSNEVLDWDYLSNSERHLICVARVIISNFDIIITHKPLAGLSPSCAAKVVELLQEFVDFRGVEQSESTEFRSAKTCFMSDTLTHEACVSISDSVILVSPDGVRCVLSSDELALRSLMQEFRTQSEVDMLASSYEGAEVSSCSRADIALKSTVFASI